MEQRRLIDKETYIETRCLLWHPHYRLNLFNNYCWHKLGFLRLMGLVLVVTIGSEWAADHFAWNKLWVTRFAFGGLAAWLAWAVWRSRVPTEKDLRKVSDGWPVLSEVSENGIEGIAPSGEKDVLDLDQVTEWRSGKHVCVVRILAPKGKRDVILPAKCFLNQEAFLRLSEILRRRCGAPAVDL